MEADSSVGIVGGGPIGLALALHLDMYGVKSTVFNTEPEARWHPKGNIHNARTMELFRKLGIADSIRALGLPGDHPFDVAYFTRLNAFEIARVARHRETNGCACAMPAQQPISFLSPLIASTRCTLNSCCSGRRPAGQTSRCGSAGRSRTSRRTRTASRSRPEAPTARRKAGQFSYIVGCDGGRSTVRRALGVRYDGEEGLMNVFMSGEIVSIHMSIPQLYEVLGPRRAWMYITANPDTRVVIISLNGVDEFMMHKPRRSGEAIDEDGVRRFVQKAIGVEIAVRIVGQRGWNAGGYLVAECFQRGRVLLAGDAVHLFTPTGGFGLNTGIEDVGNLSWKLAAVVQGWGGERLLETYESERKPVALRNAAVAREMGKAWHDLTVTAAIEQDTPAGAAERARAAQSPFVLENHFVRPEDRDWLGVVLGARYDNSPIVIPDGPPPADELERYTASSVPGGRAPHLWLDDKRSSGSSLFDRLGRYFTLLRLPGAPADTARLEAAARKAGVPLTILDVAAAAGAGTLPAQAHTDPSRPAYRLAGR